MNALRSFSMKDFSEAPTPNLGCFRISHHLSCSGKRFLLSPSLSSRILELEWGQEKKIAGKFGDLSNNVYFCNKI